MPQSFTKLFEEIDIDDVAEVGGKNASLGEMIKAFKGSDINIPGGFAVTAAAYKYFLSQTGLDGYIKQELKDLNIGNLEELARRGKNIREKIKASEFPEDFKKSIVEAFRIIEQKYGKGADFAVRSSATAEDLPGASFAYPYGAFDNTVIDVVKKAGFRSAVTTISGTYAMDINRFFLNRIRPGGLTGQALLNHLTYTHNHLNPGQTGTIVVQ